MTRLGSAALVLAVLAWPRAAAEEPSRADQAERLYEARDWAAAERAYAALERERPADPRPALRRGACLHQLGRHADALAAFERSASLGPAGPMLHLWVARSLARQGRSDEALARLGSATDGGLAQASLVEGEPDFESLRSHPRFASVLAAVDRNARPCAHAPEYRQLDFWLGEWDVTSAGQPAGTSRVELILKDCVVYENWTGLNGMVGKSFNIYDAARKRWQQTWVDSTGTVLEFHGQFAEGALRYAGEAPTTGPDGRPATAMHRLTFFDQGRDQVRQLWEQSTDRGKTWAVLFDGTYRRRE